MVGEEEEDEDDDDVKSMSLFEENLSQNATPYDVVGN